MRLSPRNLVFCGLTALGLSLLGLTACLSESTSRAAPVVASLASSGRTQVLVSWTGSNSAPVPALPKAARPWTLVQAAPAPEATSSATTKAETPAPPPGPGAISGASSLTEANGASYCLKCHGPFEKVQEGTKDYVTQWDEQVNPHVYVPHDSKTITNCTECHQAHPIPFKAGEAQPKAPVQYCYSCHHTEELVSCKECHKE